MGRTPSIRPVRGRGDGCRTAPVVGAAVDNGAGAGVAEPEGEIEIEETGNEAATATPAAAAGAAAGTWEGEGRGLTRTRRGDSESRMAAGRAAEDEARNHSESAALAGPGEV